MTEATNLLDGFKERVRAVKKVWESSPRDLGAGDIVSAMFALNPLLHAQWTMDLSVVLDENHQYKLVVTRKQVSERLRSLRAELNRRLPGENLNDTPPPEKKA